MTPVTRSQQVQTELIKSINDSTKSLNTFTLTFFATCIYVAIAVAAISDEALLFGSEVHLPLLNVKVPLVHFFILAPLLIGFLHLHLLLQEYFQFRKLERLSPRSRVDGVAALFSPGLPASSYLGTGYRSRVQLVLRLLRFGIYQVLPLLLLCWIQVRFLPYHGWRITLCHQVLVLLDICLISYYSRKLSLLRKVPPAQLKWMPLRIRTVVRSVVLVIVAVFSLLYAVVPGTWLESPEKTMPFADWLDLKRNLSLRDSTWVREHPVPELLAARNVTRDNLDAVYLELARGINLARRDLRYADFSNSNLFNADLRGADLSGAILFNTDLRGAKVLPDTTHKPVRLVKADLREADLRDLQLVRADLAGANLHRADLRRTDLSRGRLEFTTLRDAKLTGSKLFSAVLIGADLRGAYLEGVDFTNARLEGAVLAETHLEGAQFNGATVAGVLLSNSSLQGSTALVLNEAILRQARLRAVNFCQRTDPKEGPMLTDLRDLDFTTPTHWGKIIARLKEGAHAEVRVALERLEAARERDEKEATACLAGDKEGKPKRADTMAHRRLLYGEGPLQDPMAGWPPVSEQGLSQSGGWGEAEFYEHLATALWDHACQDSLLARTLVERALGNHPSSDPLLNAHLAFNYMRRQGNNCADDQRDGEVVPCPGFAEIEAKVGERIVEIARSSPLCSSP
jgi:uncharacterized protein YjbI with pentapeptide repeats